MAEQKQITIPEGATLSGLAQQYGTTTQELQKLNPSIIDPNKIFAGSQLNLPGVQAAVPTNGLIITEAGSGIGPTNEQLAGFNQQQPLNNITQEPFKGVFGPGDIINQETGQLKSKPSPYKAGFEKATQDGLGEIKTGGEARGVIDSYVPSTGTDEKSLSFLQNDPFISDIQKKYQDFNNVENQRTSLVNLWKQGAKELGIEGIDEKLLNMENIMRGSEDMIRQEITKAGGFASERQVQKMLIASNKQMILEYQRLLDLKESKNRYLNTLMGLEKEDREAINAKYERDMNFDFQIEDYRQRAISRATASLDRVQKAIGWEGILEATQNDPYTMRLIEKTYGMPQGGLYLAAKTEFEERAVREKEKGLDIELKEAQIAKTLADIPTEEEKVLGIQLKKSALATDELQRQKLAADIQKSLTTPSGKPISSATALQIADSQASLSMLEELDSTIKNNKNLFGPIKGRLLALSPYATETQSVQSTINSTKQIVGKFLEGGVLRKEDEAKYEKILPKLSDTSEVAMRKLANVRNLVELKIASQRDILEAAGYNPAIPSSDIIIGPDGLEYEITN